ncbi:MAG: PIN domain-containing protein [Calditrichaeota bacterium]|nr:MAG: PIN domain-containing protein [Calditrichota bacterium]
MQIFLSIIWRETFGLFVNDSIIVATMMQHNIQNLATNDSDFDQLPNITIWKPSSP